MTSLKTLDMSNCKLTALTPPLFLLPQLSLADFSTNQITFNGSNCITNSTSAVLIDLSHNPWHGTDVNQAIGCLLLGSRSSIDTLVLDDVGLVRKPRAYPALFSYEKHRRWVVL